MSMQFTNSLPFNQGKKSVTNTYIIKQRTSCRMKSISTHSFIQHPFNKSVLNKLVAWKRVIKASVFNLLRDANTSLQIHLYRMKTME